MHHSDDGCPESLAEVTSSTTLLPTTGAANDHRYNILASMDPSSFETEEFSSPINESDASNSNAHDDGVAYGGGNNSSAVAETATSLQSVTSSFIESNESVTVVTEPLQQNFSDGVTVASQWNEQQG